MKYLTSAVVFAIVILGSLFFVISRTGFSAQTPASGQYRNTPISLVPQPTQALYRGGWSDIEPGISIQHFPYTFQDAEYVIQVIRVEPELVNITLEYDQAGKFISEWQQEDSIVMNAGFFKEHNAPVGLLYIDGERRDQHRIAQQSTGMLVLDENSVEIRDLSKQPLAEGEVFQNALQSYPMLISDSKVAVTGRSTNQDRRTAVGIDEDGALYFIVSPSPYLTLFEFATQLKQSNILFTQVLNLDGGGSTGISISMGALKQLTNSQTPVPSVLVVKKK